MKFLDMIPQWFYGVDKTMMQFSESEYRNWIVLSDATSKLIDNVTYILGLSPQQIEQKHPDLFTRIKDIMRYRYSKEITVKQYIGMMKEIYDSVKSSKYKQTELSFSSSRNRIVKLAKAIRDMESDEEVEEVEKTEEKDPKKIKHHWFDYTNTFVDHDDSVQRIKGLVNNMNLMIANNKLNDENRTKMERAIIDLASAGKVTYKELIFIFNTLNYKPGIFLRNMFSREKV